jgi:hypothetical protein
VGEEQAIGYFTDGCTEGTLLKHKLHRAEPKTMANFMVIAYKYASADSAARVWGPQITHPEYPICIQFTIP